MKKKHITRVIILLAAAALAMCLNGCGRVDNTIAEPDEITVEYLSGEYAEQLVRDGAEVSLGTVSIAEENGTYALTVEKMVIVESDITEEGYYVADKNLQTTVPLDSEARITCLLDESDEPEIISVDEFAEIISDESFDPLETGNEKLFDVYTISGSAVMILAKELPANN